MYLFVYFILICFVFRLSDEMQFLCYQFVYQKFLNDVISENRRQIIVNVFLIPIISYCRKNVAKKVYTNMIDFILMTVNENLLANDSGKVLYFVELFKVCCCI